MQESEWITHNENVVVLDHQMLKKSVKLLTPDNFYILVLPIDFEKSASDKIEPNTEARYRVEEIDESFKKRYCNFFVVLIFVVFRIRELPLVYLLIQESTLSHVQSMILSISNVAVDTTGLTRKKLILSVTFPNAGSRAVAPTTNQKVSSVCT